MLPGVVLQGIARDGVEMRCVDPCRSSWEQTVHRPLMSGYLYILF